MKKLILAFASLCLVLSVYSCRETNKEKEEDAVEETMEEVNVEVEKTMDEAEEAVDSIEIKEDDVKEDIEE